MQILFAAASNSSAGASSVPKKVLLGCPRHDASSCHSHALFRGGGNIVASTTVKLSILGTDSRLLCTRPSEDFGKYPIAGTPCREMTTLGKAESVMYASETVRNSKPYRMIGTLGTPTVGDFIGEDAKCRSRQHRTKSVDNVENEGL